MALRAGPGHRPGRLYGRHRGGLLPAPGRHREHSGACGRNRGRGPARRGELNSALERAEAVKDRAKAWLFAASRLAGFAIRAGLELRAEVVFCPPVIERFTVSAGRAVSAPTRRTLRTNCRAIGRALAAYPEPAPVPLPRERAKKPYAAEEISAYLALADAQARLPGLCAPQRSSAWGRGRA